MVKKNSLLFEEYLNKKSSTTTRVTELGQFFCLFYINLFIIKPFFLIREKETHECDEDTEFTAPLITAFFGRYDNESPPLLIFFFRITKRIEQTNKFIKNLKVF